MMKSTAIAKPLPSAIVGAPASPPERAAFRRRNSGTTASRLTRGPSAIPSAIVVVPAARPSATTAARAKREPASTRISVA